MENNKVKQGQSNETTLNKQEALFLKYKKAIVVAVAVIILLIAGAFLYKTQISGPREDKASTTLAVGQDFFAQGDYEKALNGDGAQYPGFLKIASDYSGTDAGNLANLYAGLSYAQLDKWQEAVKYLEEFSTRGDQLISPASQAALGDAYAHIKQLDKAVDAFKNAAKMADKKAENGANNAFSPTYLLKAAIILESQNKKADALEIYQDIKKNYQNSSLVQSGEIEKYIERASM